MINGPTIQEDIANALSKAVLDPAEGAGSKVLAQSWDMFVRETEGGKEVVSKIGLYAAIPYVAVGVLLGYILSKR